MKTISGDKKRKNIKKLKENGIIMTKQPDIVTCLNKAFISRVSNWKAQMPKSNLLEELKSMESPRENLLQPSSIEEYQLNKLIKDMKKTTSSGPDSINGIVLGDIYPSIKRTLLHLINLSICTGIFPAIFKKTKITPILKTGKDPLDPLSYRPISNTCAIGKILERCFFSQVMDHIKGLGLMNPNHHGGIAQHSTSTCVAQIVHDTQKQ